MAARTIKNWLEVIAAKRDDEDLARFLLDDLRHYRGGSQYEDDVEQCVALFAAIRRASIQEA